jgi:hypothetical protein
MRKRNKPPADGLDEFERGGAIMVVYRQFATLAEAAAYRRTSGCGGWIFEAPDVSTIFPPQLTPADIMLHPLTRGRSGRLIP